MKRRLLVLALLAIHHEASSQSLSAGVLGGLNITDLDAAPEPVFPVERRHLGNIGGFVRIAAAPGLDFEGRLFWLRTGVDLGESPLDGFTSGRFDIDYVAVPLLVRYGGTGDAVRPYIIGGVELGFKTRASASLVVQGTVFEDDAFDADVRSNNVSLDIGGGVELPGGRFSVIVEALYAHGMRNINVAEDSPDDVTTRAIRLNVGLRF